MTSGRGRASFIIDAGANADMTDLAETATLPTAATGTKVGAAVRGADDVVTASRSTKGVITLESADQANADTLPE